jgi:hypothetical protein
MKGSLSGLALGSCYARAPFTLSRVCARMHRALIQIQPADHHLLAYYCRLQIARQTLSPTTRRPLPASLPWSSLAPLTTLPYRPAVLLLAPLLGTLVPLNNRLQTCSNLQDASSPHPSEWRCHPSRNQRSDRFAAPGCLEKASSLLSAAQPALQPSSPLSLSSTSSRLPAV